MKNLQKNVSAILEEKRNDFEFMNEYLDINDVFYNWREFDTLEEFEEEVIENYIYTTEIIYYAKAINFLKENDPSLREAFEEAYWMWFTCEDMNSERLATILLQSYLSQELGELISELEELQK